MVIAGERMERVIGERRASADRSEGHPAARLGTVAHRSSHEWNSHRTDLNFNVLRLSKRLHRFAVWPLGSKPFRLLWPSVALRPSSVLELRACQRHDIPEVASGAWQAGARCRGSDTAVRAVTFRLVYHGGRAEGHRSRAGGDCGGTHGTGDRGARGIGGPVRAAVCRGAAIHRPPHERTSHRTDSESQRNNSHRTDRAGIRLR